MSINNSETRHFIRLIYAKDSQRKEFVGNVFPEISTLALRLFLFHVVQFLEKKSI